VLDHTSLLPACAPRLEHLPTLMQVRALVQLDGGEPSSY
jgi:hypothetical protein